MLDTGLMKNFYVTESKYVQFRWEMFNAPNHVNLSNPGTTLGTPTFGRITQRRQRATDATRTEVCVLMAQAFCLGRRRLQACATGMRQVAYIFLLGGLILNAQNIPDRLRSLVERAQAAEQQQNLDEAVSLYEEILKIRPGWASAELNLGLVHHSRAEYSKAIHFLTQALQHNAALHSALLFRGASYFHVGKYAEAVRDLKSYLRQKPDDIEALSLLANSALAMNDPAEAALAFASLARITNQPSVYFQLSECYVQLARTAMTRFSGADAGDYRLRIASDEKSLGSQAIEKVDFETATRDLMKTTRSPALSNQVIYSAVRACLRLANTAVAKVIALAPESTWAGLLRAQAAEKSGDMDKAEKEYEQAIERAGDELEIYVRSGQFEAKHGRFDRALVLYGKASAIEPANARVIGLIGEVHALPIARNRRYRFSSRH